MSHVDNEAHATLTRTNILALRKINEALGTVQSDLAQTLAGVRALEHYANESQSWTDITFALGLDFHPDHTTEITNLINESGALMSRAQHLGAEVHAALKRVIGGE